MHENIKFIHENIPSMYEIQLKNQRLRDFLTLTLSLTVLSSGIYVSLRKILSVALEYQMVTIGQITHGVAWGMVFYACCFAILLVLKTLLKNKALVVGSAIKKHFIFILLYTFTTVVAIYITTSLFQGRLAYNLTFYSIGWKVALSVFSLMLFTPHVFSIAKPSAKQKQLVKTINTYQGKATISPSDIVYIEYENRKIHIHTTTESFIANMSLASFLKQMGSPFLFKVNRDVAINMNKIDCVRKLSGTKYLVKVNNKRFEATKKRYENLKGFLDKLPEKNN